MVHIGFDVKFVESIEGLCGERERERGDYYGWLRQC
jgi:hypothetical protein